jgi:hypothetical protein
LGALTNAGPGEASLGQLSGAGADDTSVAPTSGRDYNLERRSPMPKTLPKVSKKSRPAVRAARAKKIDKILIFTKADLERQYRATRRFLARPTFKSDDPKASQNGFIEGRSGTGK